MDAELLLAGEAHEFLALLRGAGLVLTQPKYLTTIFFRVI